LPCQKSIISRAARASGQIDSRNIEAVSVEWEATSRLRIDDGVLDCVVVAVQAHVPGKQLCSVKLNIVQRTLSNSPCNGFADFVVGNSSVVRVHLEQMGPGQKTCRVVGVPPCLTIMDNR
jgi:hypothetical protein